MKESVEVNKTNTCNIHMQNMHVMQKHILSESDI